MVRNTVYTTFFFMLLGASAHAADTYISFDFPGATFTRASGINADGAVVGAYADTAGKQHGFLLSGGMFTTIDYPGAVGTAALGINSLGDIVGSHTDDASGAASAIHGFLLHQGIFTTLTYPGKLGLIAQRINDAGQITGCNHDNDMTDSMHGFLYSNGNWSALSTGMTMGTGLLPDGSLAVGFFDYSTTSGHAYFASGDSMVDFDFPFAGGSAAWDINPSGEVVGQYADTAKKTHGFLLIPSVFDPTFGIASGVTPSYQFITVDYPGATYTQAVGINASGHIVGSYRDSAGTQHAFLLVRSRRRQD